MIELQGKYAAAKIFTDLVDEGTISQVYEVLNQEFIKWGFRNFFGMIISKKVA